MFGGASSANVSYIRVFKRKWNRLGILLRGPTCLINITTRYVRVLSNMLPLATAWTGNFLNAATIATQSVWLPSPGTGPSLALCSNHSGYKARGSVQPVKG